MESLEALAAAVQSNQAAQVAEVLEKHPEWKGKLDDPMPGGSFGGTALLAAVNRRNPEMIDALLRAGAEINARSHWWAGSFGVLDNPSGLEDFLIERGARVDAHAAARLGRLDRLKELIAGDPGLVHARGGDGQLPLHFAATVEIAEFLVAQGAEIDARDIDHESTAAQWMARERQHVARFLVSRGCATDVLMASALGDVELVRRHLDADPAATRMSVSEEWFPKRDERSGGSIYIWVLGGNRTAHQIARGFGHRAVLALLMERSPAELKLALACETGDEAAVREMLANSPGLAARLTEADRRRLPSAADDNNTVAVRLMLEAGWPVETPNQGGATALHGAAFNGNAAMAREILRFHPPLEVEDFVYHGKPMGWAMHGSLHAWNREKGDYAGVVAALLDAGAKMPEPQVPAGEAVLAVLRARRDAR